MNIPKALIRSLYDIQGQRVQTGNRICAEIKSRLGQDPGDSEKALAVESQIYLAEARKEYDRITDAFVLNQAHKYLKVDYEGYEIITDAAMLLFVESYVKQLEQEENMTKVIAKIVHQHPMWDAFLDGVKGCGPLMSAVILTEFDPHKAPRISNFWKYAGLDVADDGRGRGRYKDHLIDQDYIDKDGNTQTKKGITFNPFLKTKLVGVLGSCLMKAGTNRSTGEKQIYKKIYDDYKHRLENHIDHKEKTKGHRHSMAVRYMVKMFVQDLWLKWREVEDLPITAPYSEAKLGMKHKKDVA